MIKKLLLLLTIAISSIVSYGQEVVQGGVKYSILNDDDLTAFVSGHTVDLPSDVTILDKVSIEGMLYNVTEIGENAFSCCTYLRSIDLSQSKRLSLIGQFAFYCCYSLTAVIMPKSLESLKIDDSAFYNCNNLVSFDFPEGVKSIGNSAFFNCESLYDIKLPESLENIGDEAFYDSVSKYVDMITIPKNVKFIGSKAFTGAIDHGASALTCMASNPPQLGEWSIYDDAIIYVPDSYVSTYRKAWSKAHILPLNDALSLDINVQQAGTLLSQIPRDRILDISSLKIHGDINGSDIQVLNKCTNLRNLDLYNARIVSGGNKYYEDFGTQTNVLTQNIFFGLKCLNSVIMPKTLTSISELVLGGVMTLRRVELPESLREIGEQAFWACSLDTIRIPESVISIGDYAFSGNDPFAIIFDGFPKCKYRAFVCNDYSTPLSERSFYISDFEKWLRMEFDNVYSGIYSSPLHDMGNLYVNDELINDLLIPSTVNRLSQYLFYKRIPFNSVWVNSVNPPTIYSETFNFEDPNFNTVLYVPEGSDIDYWLHPIWSKFNQIRTFKPSDLNSYIISHESIEICANESFQLGVVKPGAQAKGVEWTSSNNEVAYVNKFGLVTAMCDNGECVVTAMVDGQRLTCIVSVSSNGVSRADNPKIDPVSIEFVSITTDPDMMNVRLYPVGASTVINWLSEDVSASTIENGIITFREAGKKVRFIAITDNSKCAFSPEITTVSGIEDVTCDHVRPLSRDVYNLQGICVKHDASLDDINHLTPGIYIYQGQKFIVR